MFLIKYRQLVFQVIKKVIPIQTPYHHRGGSGYHVVFKCGHHKSYSHSNLPKTHGLCWECTYAQGKTAFISDKTEKEIIKPAHAMDKHYLSKTKAAHASA